MVKRHVVYHYVAVAQWLSYLPRVGSIPDPTRKCDNFCKKNYLHDYSELLSSYYDHLMLQNCV